MKNIQIILLILIIMGLGLLGTQKYWVGGVVSFILKNSSSSYAVVPVVPADTNIGGEVGNGNGTGTGGTGTGGTGILPYDSGVEGTVTLEPTCPVMREPPDPACADKPYATTIQIIAVGSPKSSPFATVESGKDGKYKIMLPPGKYALQPVGGSMLPRCGTQEVTLVPAKVLKVDLSCDTGIR